MGGKVIRRWFTWLVINQVMQRLCLAFHFQLLWKSVNIWVPIARAALSFLCLWSFMEDSSLPFRSFWFTFPPITVQPGKPHSSWNWFKRAPYPCVQEARHSLPWASASVYLNGMEAPTCLFSPWVSRNCFQLLQRQRLGANIWRSLYSYQALKQFIPAA